MRRTVPSVRDRVCAPGGLFLAPGGRLLDGRNTVGGGLNLRLPPRSVDDLDGEAVGVFRRAYRVSR
jgi:hypothetical protein